MKKELKGPLILSVSMVSFAAMTALAKIAGDEVPAIEIVFFRGLIGLPIVLAFVKKSGSTLRGNRLDLLIFRGISGTTSLIMFFYAVTQIPVADAILLNQSTPIFVLPLAAIFLGEIITRKHVLLVITAIVGVAMVIKPGADIVNIPGLIAFVSALFAAIAYVLVRKLAQSDHPSTIVFWFTLITTVTSAPLAMPGFVVPRIEIFVAIIGVGVFATAGQLLMTLAYRHAEAGRLSVFGSMGAVFGAGIDFLLWDHIPDIWTVVGGLTVITCCTMIQMLRRPVA